MGGRWNTFSIYPNTWLCSHLRQKVKTFSS